MKVLSLIYVFVLSLSVSSVRFSPSRFFLPQWHTPASSLIHQGLCRAHWRLITGLSESLHVPSELRIYKSLCDIEKPARKILCLALEFNCSLLILLKLLSCIVDPVTARVKCCSWFSRCRLSRRPDGVLGKDHNSWRQETTRLLWLQWWQWQKSPNHRQWVSFWPHSYFCKYQRRNERKWWMDGCWRNMCISKFLQIGFWFTSNYILAA